MGLGENDVDGSRTDELLLALGFSHVTTVKKHRSSFEWPSDHELSDFSVTIDQLDQVGCFAEIELVVSSDSAISECSRRIAALSQELGLRQSEKRSYLELLLDQMAGEGSTGQ